jgi:DNA-3-methyladenine glycosylase
VNPDFYARPVLDVAEALIGCVVTDGGCSGAIVETEAYHDTEPAAHSFVGLTPRTETLFGPPGRAYVYLSYGIHTMLNAVCEPEGVGAAVLIRALEPLTGIELMAARRGVDPSRPQALCSGPGKLTQALGIMLCDNGGDLARGPVVFSGRERRFSNPVVQRDRRIGITKAVELPWRFCLAGSRYLSVPVRNG